MNKSLNLLVKNKNFSSTNIGKCLFTINHSKNFQRQKVLTKENIFENVLKVEYAVRGPIVVRAGELESELKKVCCCFFILKLLFLSKMEFLTFILF